MWLCFLESRQTNNSTIDPKYQKPQQEGLNMLRQIARKYAKGPPGESETEKGIKSVTLFI